MSADLYKILGVGEDATIDEIKKTYRRLSMKYHPDKNRNNPASAEKFKEISNAYSVLGDKDNRSRYDMERKMGNGPIDLNDLFGSIFGGGGMPGMPGMSPFMGFPPGANVRVFTTTNGGDMPFGSFHSEGGIPGFGFHPNINMMSKPPAINKTIKITIQQAYSGCSLPVKIQRWCKSGNEKRDEEETLYVKIPRGIDEDEIIVAREKGHVHNNIKGEVKLFIKIVNNTSMSREGLDMIFKQTISLKEALCGLSFDLPHLNGKTYKINNDLGSVIRPGYKKIISDLGFVREESIGSLIIEFDVKFPEKMDKDSIQKLKEIL